MAQALPSTWFEPLDVLGFAHEAVDEAQRSVDALASARGVDLVGSSSTARVVAALGAAEHLRVAGHTPATWAPLSGFFAARDGWVRTHGNYPHHAAALLAALGVVEAAEVPARLGELDTAEIEERVRAGGGVAVAVRTVAEWASTDHGRMTAGDPWFTVEDRGEARPAASSRGRVASRGGPMDGVRVLDLTRVIAGPVCSQLLACLGADVLRIDAPHRPEIPELYLATGMGKRSAEADFADVATAIRRDLLPGADVVLHGYRRGSLARFGLDPEALAYDFPGLVVGTLSAWGETGPWAERPGFDSIVQAACGIADLCGRPDRPGALPVQALDHATGYLLAARVLDALARGRGSTISISLLGAARTLLAGAGSGVRRDVDVDMEDILVKAEGPDMDVRIVPPAVLLDGRPLVRPLHGCGAASLSWAESRTDRG